MTGNTLTRKRIWRAAAPAVALAVVATAYSTTRTDEPAGATASAPSAPATSPASVREDVPAPLSGLSINDDFTDRLTDVTHLLATQRPVVAGIQEGKATDYARLLRRDLGRRYGVRQDHRHDGAAGVAVTWNRWLARPLGRSVDDPSRLGGGWLELLPAGGGLLSRGVVWQDLEVDLGGLRTDRVRVAATHRPPQRYRHLWPAFDRRLAAFCEDAPAPVLVFMDANEEGGPVALVRRSGLRWHGVGIDGALTDLAADEASALPRRHSDHQAVAIPLGQG
jgi:hypothetical protein